MQKKMLHLFKDIWNEDFHEFFAIFILIGNAYDETIMFRKKNQEERIIILILPVRASLVADRRH